MGGEEDDVRTILRHLHDRLEAAEAGHVDVEDGDVDVLLGELGEDLLAALALERRLDAGELARAGAARASWP